MIVFRVGRTKYANDLTGEGARLFGGRWNHKLISCIYTSESRSLAILEYTVNVNVDDIPRAMSMATIEIPENNILQLTVAELPGNWRDAPAPAETKNLVSRLLTENNFLAIKIPSAVIPEEFNYVLNPAHAGSAGFKIIKLKDFVYDIRIKYT